MTSLIVSISLSPMSGMSAKPAGLWADNRLDLAGSDCLGLVFARVARVERET